MHKLIIPTLCYEFNLLAYLGLPLTAGFSWHQKFCCDNEFNCRVKREKPTRCNQSDVYYQTISTCFGHHYAHHQENKTVHCRIWCSALVVMAVVVWSWDASCVHCESESNSNLHSAYSLHPSSTQPQPSQPVQNTICGSAHYCSPDDGHNDARNMLR